MRAPLFIFSLVILLVLNVCCSADLTLSFAASADPNLNPDANSNTINVWTVATSGSVAGSFLGNSANNGGGSVAGAGNPAWALYAKDDGQSSATASIAALIGRSLSLAGDSISLDFDNGWIDFGRSVGITFLNGSSAQSTFRFAGGESSYRIDDGTGGNFDTGIGFTANGFNVKLTLDNSSGGYTLKAGSSTFSSRTLALGSSTITGIRVYDLGAGPGSNFDVFFNNLVITAVPEASPIVAFPIVAAIVGTAGTIVRHRRRATTC